MKGLFSMNTIESWDNFTRYYGGIVGAKDCFELVCEELLRYENPAFDVHRVKASRGDGGIDIYVSNGETVQIYQCKFFVDKLTSSRWNQIKSSFLRILDLHDICVDEWFLCIPKEFTKEDICEIENFKKMYAQHNIRINFLDGNELISRMKKANICDKWFSIVTPRVFCSNAPRVCPEYIEREEIELLKEIILNDKQNVLISGIGGMGKTTLAEKIFDEIKSRFDIALWITYKENIISSMAMAMAKDNMDKGLIEYFEETMNMKNNQRNIIFIDDVDRNYLSDKTRDTIERNAIVVLTSRLESVAGYITHIVEPFDDETCVSLFSKYYGRNIKPQDKKIICQISNRFGRNTLLIELIARAANKSVKELNSFLKSILKKGISNTNLRVQNYKEKTYARISEHLSTLYSFEDITHEQKRILANFSLTGERGVTGKFIEIIKASEEDIGDILEFGWIKRTTQGFYMHTLIRESIKNQVYTYSMYIDQLKNFYLNNKLYFDNCTMIEKSMHFDIILEMLKYTGVDQEQDVYLLYHLIQLIDSFAYYDALDNVVGLAVQELEKFDESKARARIGCDIFNAAGLAYLSFDKIKALVCFLCEKQLLDKFFAENEKLKTAFYCNMGLTYIGMDFEKAKQLLDKALELEKEYYGKESIQVADVYHNIGKNYFVNQDYENAASFFEKALKIKRMSNECNYSLIKTEFALANAYNFMLKKPFLQEEIERIRKLYVSVLEGYNLLRNINQAEYNNTIHIIADFLNKIGETNSAHELKELIKRCNCCRTNIID